jgi:hypothetical protein
LLTKIRIIAGFVPLALASAEGQALAQQAQPSASDIANARALGTEGVQLADRGECTAAIDRLWRAEALYHAPTILGRLGECQVALGKIVTGTETLQRVLRDPIGPTSPPAFLAARDRAQKVLDGALPMIGKLRIRVAQVPGLVVKVDGEPVPSAGLDVDRLTDPGAHQIEATAPGYRAATQAVTLAEGGTEQVVLKLEPDSGTAAAAPPPGALAAPVVVGATAQPAAGPAAPPQKDEGSGPSRAGPYALLIGGGVGIIVGSVFGGLALAKKSTLDSACNPKSNCPESAQDDIDSLNTNATIATVGFIVGGVAAAAGGAWLIFGSGGKSEPAHSASSRVVVRPWLGPTSAGLLGAF